MNYFHDTLLRYGFLAQREGFYIRANNTAPGSRLFCLVNEDARPRKLLLWQAQRVLLRGDVVTIAALEQVLQRVLGKLLA
ncbi:MAG TPA: hypothetical protein VK364_07830 [Hymenobacter sp.]|nr:hypothetical protein [Hymenobacter sp.]